MICDELSFKQRRCPPGWISMGVYNDIRKGEYKITLSEAKNMRNDLDRVIERAERKEHD